jgi:hypothetical protein
MHGYFEKIKYSLKKKMKVVWNEPGQGLVKVEFVDAVKEGQETINNIYDIFKNDRLVQIRKNAETTYAQLKDLLFFQKFTLFTDGREYNIQVELRTFYTNDLISLASIRSKEATLNLLREQLKNRHPELNDQSNKRYIDSLDFNLDLYPSSFYDRPTVQQKWEEFVRQITDRYFYNGPLEIRDALTSFLFSSSSSSGYASSLTEQYGGRRGSNSYGGAKPQSSGSNTYSIVDLSVGKSINNLFGRIIFDPESSRSIEGLSTSDKLKTICFMLGNISELESITFSPNFLTTPEPFRVMNRLEQFPTPVKSTIGYICLGKGGVFSCLRLIPGGLKFQGIHGNPEIGNTAELNIRTLFDFVISDENWGEQYFIRVDSVDIEEQSESAWLGGDYESAPIAQAAIPLPSRISEARASAASAARAASAASAAKPRIADNAQLLKKATDILTSLKRIISDLEEKFLYIAGFESKLNNFKDQIDTIESGVKELSPDEFIRKSNSAQNFIIDYLRDLIERFSAEEDELAKVKRNLQNEKHNLEAVKMKVDNF